MKTEPIGDIVPALCGHQMPSGDWCDEPAVTVEETESDTGCGPVFVAYCADHATTTKGEAR